MKKRLLSALLCLCMVICMMPTVSLAADESETAGNITWELSDSGTLTISGTGNMQDYGYNGAPWADEKENIKQVVVEDGVTSIGAWAFGYCTELAKITLPQTMTAIGDNAFNQCSSLNKITIPDGVARLGEGVFTNCTSLKTVTLPASVSSIELGWLGAFSGCTAMTAFTVDKNSASYSTDNGVLLNGDKTEVLICPQGKSGSYTVPDGVKTIRERAFYICNNLTNVTLPASVASIEKEAFSGCQNNLTTVKMAEGLTSIGESAFYNCAKLKSADIPSTVTSIGSSAFSNCPELTKAVIPTGVTSIESSTFSYTGLRSVIIPGNVKSIGSSAFSGCTSLLRADISNGVESIGSGAFSSCKALDYITIADSVTSIGRDAFDSTGYAGNKSNWKDEILYCGHWVLGAGAGIDEANISDGIIGIADEAFKNCALLTSVTLPNSLRAIGESAFVDCSSMKNLTVPARVEIVGEHAFGMNSEIDFGAWEIVYTPADGFTATVHADGAAEAYCKENEIKYDAEAHTIETVSAVDATCTEAGHTAGTRCSVCGKVLEETKEIPATGHSFHEKASDKLAAEATCTEAAKYYVQCDNCNEVSTDKTVSVGNPKGHSFTNYVYNNDAKPGVDGTETAACDNGCGETDTRTASGTAKPVIHFTDVNENQYYAKAVQWAVANEITNGMGDNKFEPDTTCTRGQIVTFLWRAKGKPEPTSNYNPFNDVFESDYYYKAVLWAVEKGITTGTSATTFSPNAGCTRAQVATFLWRAEEKPSGTGYNPFVDVNTSEYYGDAVLWAVSTGITTGISQTEFAPDSVCTRGQIVTFLWRDMA